MTRTVADDGLLGYLISQVQAYEQNAAVTFLTVAKADSGVVHVLGLNGVAETFGRTLSQRAGDVWNVADHGADGTAAGVNGDPGDDAAFNNGLLYAKARSYTVVSFPSGTWSLTVSSTYPGYAIPSNTKVAGAANNATILTWNDVSNGGYSLLVSPALANGARNSNVVFRTSWCRAPGAHAWAAAGPPAGTTRSSCPPRTTSLLIMCCRATRARSG